MHERTRRFDEFQNPTIQLDMVSRGAQTQLSLSEISLNIENESGNVGFLIENPEFLFASALIENPDKAFLSTEIRQIKPSLYEQSIASIYSELTGKFGPHNCRDNFIAFGHGSAKRYGFLTDSQDPTLLIRGGTVSIGASEYSQRRKNKQLRSYEELEAFFEGSESRKYSRKKILGATAVATTITIGGTMYLIYKKSHTV